MCHRKGLKRWNHFQFCTLPANEKCCSLLDRMTSMTSVLCWIVNCVRYICCCCSIFSIFITRQSHFLLFSLCEDGRFMVFGDNTIVKSSVSFFRLFSFKRRQFHYMTDINLWIRILFFRGPSIKEIVSTWYNDYSVQPLVYRIPENNILRKELIKLWKIWQQFAWYLVRLIRFKFFVRIAHLRLFFSFFFWQCFSNERSNQRKHYFSSKKLI